MLIRFLLYTSIVCLSGVAFGQLKPLDSISYFSKIKELERKLSFTYYSPDDGKWWINRLTYTMQDQQVSMKNIKAKNPASVTNKEYKERVFKFQSINPFTLDIQINEESHGRLVKGKTLHLKTYDRSPLVGNFINGLTTTPATFVAIAIPAYLDDSVRSYSDTVAHLLSEVIFTAACFKKVRKDEAAKLTLEALTGKHVVAFADGSSATRTTTKLSETVISYIEENENGFVASGILLYDPDQEVLREIRVTNTHMVSENMYTWQATDAGITWKHKTEEGMSLTILGLHYSYCLLGQEGLIELKKI